MRIIGLAIALGLIIVAAGDVSAFVDIPSALIVVGLPLGCLIFSRAGIANMFGASFAADATREGLESAAGGWAQAKTYFIGAGFIGTLIGFAIMGKNIDVKSVDDISGIGPGFALAVLTMLYGLIAAYGICLPMQKRLEDRARELTH